MRPNSMFHQLSELDRKTFIQSVLKNPHEFVLDFQKSVQKIDNHKDELNSISTKEDRLKRVSEILQL